MPALTKRFCDTAPAGRYYDDRLAGFGLYVGKSGARSFFVEYRAGRGRGAPKRRLTLGRHGHLTPEQARTMAREHLGRIAAGEDPLEGSLLVARHGKGVFVYTGLSFFRQLPAGVPGAFRLFANLLAL